MPASAATSVEIRNRVRQAEACRRFSEDPTLNDERTRADDLAYLEEGTAPWHFVNGMSPDSNSYAPTVADENEKAARLRKQVAKIVDEIELEKIERETEQRLNFESDPLWKFMMSLLDQVTAAKRAGESPKKRRVKKVERERLVKAWFMTNAGRLRDNPHYATVARISEETGVSAGAISKMEFWQTFLAQRPVPVRSVTLTDDMLAVIPVEDSSLSVLINGQAADKPADEPRSPRGARAVRNRS